MFRLIAFVWMVFRIVASTAIVVGIGVSIARADVVIDNGTSDMYFKVDGSKVTASVAQDSAKRGATVMQCKAIKGKAYETKDGATINAAYQCSSVDWIVSLKSGGGRWKKHQ